MPWWGWVILSGGGTGLVLAIGIGLGMAVERHRVVGLFGEHIRKARRSIKAGEDWAVEKMAAIANPCDRAVAMTEMASVAAPAIIGNLEALDEMVRKGVRVKGGNR